MDALNTERRVWLAELYQSNFDSVSKTCSRILGNPEDAADASQEVFLIAARTLEPGTPGAAARAWLQTVARNHAIDCIRRRKRLSQALVTLGNDDAPQADVATSVAERDFVDGVFRQLTPRERTVLWQSAVERRAVGDIAQGLRLSYMAAAQVIHRARRHAIQLATRVAIVIGALRLGRSVNRVGPSIARVVALPAIAVSVISLQTSGPLIANRAQSPATLVAPATAARPVSSTPSSGHDSPGTLGPAPNSLPGSVAARPDLGGVGSPINAVKRILAPPSISRLTPRVPTITSPSLPAPSVAVPSASPLPQPSVPALAK